MNECNYFVSKLTMGNANINNCMNDLINKCTVMYLSFDDG